VVLLDVKMPGLSGLEVIKRIKEKTPSPQVILLTGHSSVQDAEKGMGLGAFDYLMKPIKIDELIGVLRSAGAGKGTGDAGEA
jgi:YesN/AraC family two-component response regulator